MPLEQRLIEPVLICRDNVPQIRDPRCILDGRELECMANGTMANIIRQLSCLAFYADDIFNGILAESTRLFKKTEKIQGRIMQLKASVSNLDFQQEEVSFVDVNCGEIFKSSSEYEQEVLSRQTMPNSLLRKYEMCDAAPPLDKLNVFREDGKDAMKFYTNPNFFIDQWRDEMLKKTEKEKFSKKMISTQSLNTTKQIEESHNVKQSRKPVRRPENTNEKYRRMMSQQGEFFVDSNSIPESQRTVPNYSTGDYSPYGTIEISTNPTDKKSNLSQDAQNSFNQSRSSQPYRLNDTNQSAQKENTNHVRFNQTPEIITYPNSPINIKSDQMSTVTSAQSSSIPIPPPMPEPGAFLSNNNSINIPNNNTSDNNNNNPTVKSSMGVTNAKLPPSLAQEIQAKHQTLRSAPVAPRPPITQMDARSTLLASIRNGIQLRSVQARKQKQVEKGASLKNDVASILQRRVAMQLSDSESNASNNEESDDDWVDG